jgi:hypothetical protein
VEKRLNEQTSLYWNNKAGFTIIVPCSNLSLFEHEKIPCPEAFYDSVLSLFHNTFGHRADAFLTDHELYTSGRTLKKCEGGSYEYDFFNFEEGRDLLRYVHNLTNHGVRFDERFASRNVH